MEVSSLGMNGTSVSPCRMESIEEICIWVFHGLFDVWVDRVKVMVIDWATILSWIKSNCKVAWRSWVI